MRNINEYPVTKQEVIDAISDAMWAVAYEQTLLVGDIRPYALRLAREWIEKHGPAHFHG